MDVSRYLYKTLCSLQISARIWTLRRMRKCNTSASYLATLALSDCLFLVLLVGNELQYPWMVGVLDLQVSLTQRANAGDDCRSCSYMDGEGVFILINKNNKTNII